ncbi:MAG TPA: hypothetical protein VNI77_08875 [Nitrososphaera sp.]|nr:hypothetical protein [Nitrososphaera sp.]
MVGFSDRSSCWRQWIPKLRAAGLSARKIEYLKDLAARASDGRLKLSRMSRMGDEEVVEQLIQVKGIGRWAVEMFLIFCLGRPDVLPLGDLGIRKAMQKAYYLEVPTREIIRGLLAPGGSTSAPPPGTSGSHGKNSRDWVVTVRIFTSSLLSAS